LADQEISTVGFSKEELHEIWVKMLQDRLSASPDEFLSLDEAIGRISVLLLDLLAQNNQKILEDLKAMGLVPTDS
jgi:hypothetical protein